MPIWLRKFTFEKLREHFDKQRDEIEKQQNLLKNTPNKEVARPNITPVKQPTYTTKAPKK